MSGVEHWKKDINGNWNTAADWDSGQIPDATTSVYLGPFATHYTVTSSMTDAAQDLTIYTAATLDITAGIFSLGRYFNSDGVVKIETGAEMDLGVPGQYTGYNNAGKIELLGGTLRVDFFALGFNDGGDILLSNNANNLITGGTATQNTKFLNLNQTIMGSGSIAGQYLQLINAHYGVVDASGTVGLTINTGIESQNLGVIESTNTGGLLIDGNIQDDGVLKSAAGLVDVTGNIDGNGILDISGAGKMELGGYANPDIHFEAGSTGTLILDHASTSYFDTIYGLYKGTHIDLRDVVDNSSTKPSLSIVGSQLETTLMVTDGAHTATLYLDFPGSYAGYTKNSFSLGVDGHGGTLLTVVA